MYINTVIYHYETITCFICVILFLLPLISWCNVASVIEEEEDEEEEKEKEEEEKEEEEEEEEKK